MIDSLSKLLVLFIATGLFISGCKEKAAGTAVQTPEVKPMPYLTNQEIAGLYAQADKVDMIFYELPISVNQDDAASAKNSVLYISPAPVDARKKCKAVGRLSWIANGSIVREADIHVDSSCHYFVFMVDNQPAAANVMTDAGISFFNNLFKQVQQRTK